MPDYKKLHSRLQDTIIGEDQKFLSSSLAVTISTGLDCSFPGIYAAYETDLRADHWLLGCLVRLDARWNGFIYLCPGIESGAFRTSSQVGVRKNCGKCRPGRLHFVRVISRRVGPFLYMGSDRRSLWAHTSAGGNGTGVRSFHGGGGASGKRMAARNFSITCGHWHRRRVGA